MNKKFHKTLTIVLAALLAINIAVTIFLAAKMLTVKESLVGRTDQYVIYVGLKDMSTQNQEISTEDALNKIDEICFKYVNGYTIQEAYGCRINENKVATRSKTIVCSFDGAAKDDIYHIADEIIETFNQDTVFIESDSIKMEYYAGK